MVQEQQDDIFLLYYVMDSGLCITLKNMGKLYNL